MSKVKIDLKTLPTKIKIPKRWREYRVFEQNGVYQFEYRTLGTKEPWTIDYDLHGKRGVDTLMAQAGMLERNGR